MRERIIAEIRRLAAANDGQPPGVGTFERETAILEHQWRGRIWARWGDALAEAGFAPNTLQQRLDTETVLAKLAEACRHHGRLPTMAELKLYKRNDAALPSLGALTRHFGDQAGMVAALARWSRENGADDVAALLPDEPRSAPRPSKPEDGSVYLIQYGPHFKIGRGSDLEKRVKQVQIALPEAGTLVHAITTDDPPGIEAYWHRRFAEKRLNGEWFKLTPADVLAFKRRKFQ